MISASKCTRCSTSLRGYEDTLKQYCTAAIDDKGTRFFVSRRIASRIHEISDLKKALVLSLRAEYTRLRDQKNILSTRGTRNGNGFRSRSREKGKPGIVIWSTSVAPALSFRCGLVFKVVNY